MITVVSTSPHAAIANSQTCMVAIKNWTHTHTHTHTHTYTTHSHNRSVLNSASCPSAFCPVIPGESIGRSSVGIYPDTELAPSGETGRSKYHTFLLEIVLPILESACRWWNFTLWSGQGKRLARLVSLESGGGGGGGWRRGRGTRGRGGGGSKAVSQPRVKWKSSHATFSRLALQGSCWTAITTSTCHTTASRARISLWGGRRGQTNRTF